MCKTTKTRQPEEDKDIKWRGESSCPLTMQVTPAQLSVNGMAALPQAVEDGSKQPQDYTYRYVMHGTFVSIPLNYKRRTQPHGARERGFFGANLLDAH